MAQKNDNTIIRSIHQVEHDEVIQITLSDGKLDAKITKSKEN